MCQQPRAGSAVAQASQDREKNCDRGYQSHYDDGRTPHLIADLIRKALEYVTPERLIITADCGFGREGLSRRIAFYKCVALVQGTNIVRKELGLPEVYIRAADPQFAFREALEMWHSHFTLKEITT